MPSDLHDLAFLHSHDPGAGANRRQAMSYNDDGAPAHDRAHVLLNDPFALVVERGGRLIQDQNAGICHKRPGDRDALTLAPREIGAPFFNHRVVALRQLGDKFVRASEASRMHNHHTRHGGVAKRDVLMDRAVEKNVLLQDDTDLPAQPAGIELGNVDAIEHHLARLRTVEALDELG